MSQRVGPATSDRPLPRVLRAVVVDALTRGVGAQLPTNAHYARTVGGTAGTIQRAMGELAEQGAVTISSHGARGRTVTSIDLGLSWALAGLAPVRLLLPPGGSERLAGPLPGRSSWLGVRESNPPRQGHSLPSSPDE